MSKPHRLALSRLVCGVVIVGLSSLVGCATLRAVGQGAAEALPACLSLAAEIPAAIHAGSAISSNTGDTQAWGTLLQDVPAVGDCAVTIATRIKAHLAQHGCAPGDVSCAGLPQPEQARAAASLAFLGTLGARQ